MSHDGARGSCGICVCEGLSSTCGPASPACDLAQMPARSTTLLNRTSGELGGMHGFLAYLREVRRQNSCSGGNLPHQSWEQFIWINTSSQLARLCANGAAQC